MGRKDETLPAKSSQVEDNLMHLSHLKVVKVFTDMKSVQENLTDPKFVFVDDMSNADIVFIRKHFKEFK
jgi:hypothetical protein